MLLNLDYWLFKVINTLPHSFLTDSFFAFFSFAGYFGIIWIFIGIVLYVNLPKQKKQKLTVLYLTVFASLLFSETIKMIIRRPRPEINFPTVIVFADSINTFSFPSSHAAVAFAAFYILTKIYTKMEFRYFILAFLISFSRIYLGKHYPSDVIAGGILGYCTGYVIYKLKTVLTQVNYK